MKKHYILFLFLFVSCLAFAQKNEKIKGSKIVTTKQKEIGSFEAIEVTHNIEVFLEKGEKSELKIEADDNLHEIIIINLSLNTLRIYTAKKVANFKKLIVRVTYTDDLKMATAKNEAVINAIQEIQLNEIMFKSYDNSKLNLNVNSKNFSLQSDNNSKTELNLKSEKATIQLSKNATLKALITSTDIKCDLYQKSKANIEGDVTNAIIRLDNNAEFIGNNLAISNAELVVESHSKASVNINSTISIDASGNSKIQLFGNQKIEIKQFIDHATLEKKPIE